MARVNRLRDRELRSDQQTGHQKTHSADVLQLPPNRPCVTEPLAALRFHVNNLNHILTDLDDNGEPITQKVNTDSVDQFITQVVRQANRRVVTVESCHPTLPLPLDLKVIHDLQEELVTRGARVRLIVNGDAVSDNNAMSWPREMRDAGANIRVTGLHLPTMTIVDGQAALLCASEGDFKVSLVNDRRAVEAIRAVHSALWESAVTLELFERLDIGWEAAGVLQQILELLGSGHSDEAAARKLDISVRTYRRYVADLLVRLGAKSRFHAGARAAQLGLIHDQSLSGEPESGISASSSACSAGR